MRRLKALYQQKTIWADYESDDALHVCDMHGVRTGETLQLSQVELQAPCEPRSIVCVGRNYAKHVQEMGGDADNLPKEPGLFLKSANTLSLPDAPIAYPNWTENFHYEGELAVVINKTMSKITEAEALDYVLGYTCALDMTARDKQRADLQWTRGKSADGFCPLGSWLETDLDPTQVNVQTRVNGVLKQDGNTRDMIFPVAYILSYISNFMTLLAGDVVLTGTPDGVGPVEIGDEIEVTVADTLTMKRTIVAE